MDNYTSIKAYLLVTILIFLLVGTFHLIKIIYGFEVKIGNQTFPKWLSWAEMIIAFYFAYVGNRLR